MRVETIEADKVEMNKRSNETQNLFVPVGALWCRPEPAGRQIERRPAGAAAQNWAAGMAQR